MELETAARRHILTDDTIRSLVGLTGDPPRFWVWKFREEENIDGSGKIGIVVNRSNSWAAADPIRTVRYPVLHVDVIADPSRNADGTYAALDAEDRAFNVASNLQRLFNWRLRGTNIGAVGSNPGLLVIACQLWAEPRLITPADQHPPAEGDTRTVRTEFAFEL